MGRMKDTLGDTPYPQTPGWKARDTSKAAAEQMAPISGTLRANVLAAIKAEPDGLTADECATRLNQSVLAIRPRVSELAAEKLITDSGTRRENAGGKNAIVWKQQ